MFQQYLGRYHPTMYTSQYQIQPIIYKSTYDKMLKMHKISRIVGFSIFRYSSIQMDIILNKMQFGIF